MVSGGDFRAPVVKAGKELTARSLRLCRLPLWHLARLSDRCWRFSISTNGNGTTRRWPLRILPIRICRLQASAYAAHKSIPRPTHDAAYWAEKTKGFDFSIEDHLGDVAKFNRIVWEGLKGVVPYPVQRTGANLRRNRKLLLRNAKLVESGTVVYSGATSN
jgi:hypothetical protein